MACTDETHCRTTKARLLAFVSARTRVPAPNQFVSGTIEQVGDTCSLGSRRFLQGRLASTGHTPTVNIRLHALQCSAAAKGSANSTTLY